MTEFTYVLWDYVITVKLLWVYRTDNIFWPLYESLSSSDPIRWVSEFEASLWYFNALYELHKKYGKILSTS